jgi:hypothetical protein
MRPALIALLIALALAGALHVALGLDYMTDCEPGAPETSEVSCL